MHPFCQYFPALPPKIDRSKNQLQRTGFQVTVSLKDYLPPLS